MKKLLSISVSCMLLFCACTAQNNATTSDNGYSYNDYNRYNDYNSSINYNTFYTQLSPYGRWVTYAGYGNVWQPYNSSGFTPYQTGGHWVATVDGWAWASDYNWGWAPFHYGRWLLDPAMGWVWVPGYEWAPAWVTWGNYNNYYAWAPLAPGVSINTWIPPYNYWAYVPHNCIQYNNLHHYIVRPTRTTVNNITIINNYNNTKVAYNRGPQFEEVSHFTKRPVKPVAVEMTSQPTAEHVTKQKFMTYHPQQEQGNQVTIKNPPAATSNAASESAPANGNTRNSTIKSENTLQPQTESQPAPRTLTNGRDGNVAPRVKPANNNSAVDVQQQPVMVQPEIRTPARAPQQEAAPQPAPTRTLPQPAGGGRVSANTATPVEVAPTPAPRVVPQSSTPRFNNQPAPRVQREMPVQRAVPSTPPPTPRVVRPALPQPVQRQAPHMELQRRRSRQ